MRVLKLLLILPVIFMAHPARAADVKTGPSAGDEARPENAEPQKVQSPYDRVERPKREAVKMSPTIRVSPLRQDETGNMRRMAPARADSPLLNMQAPKDMTSPPGGETPGGR
jgi:hypothetical protein